MTAGRSLPDRVRFLFAALAGIAWVAASSSCSFKNTAETGSAPVVRTLPASSVRTDQAVLNGTLEPGGVSADIWFEYGTDPSLSAPQMTPYSTAGPAGSPLPFQVQIRGLGSYRTYYFRVAARNRFGISRGEIASFPTGEYYVAFGDSITRAGGSGGYPGELSRLLERTKGYPNVVANRGGDGVSSAGGAQTVPALLASLPRAKYFLVMFGTNDARLPGPVPSGKGLKPGNPGYKGSYKANMQEIVSAVMSSGRIAALAKVPYVARPDIDLDSIRQYNEVIDELVAENRIPIVPPDFFDYFRKRPGELPDGIHPDADGYRAMAKMWLSALSR